MRLLFVNACMRGAEVSRTHALCRAFLEEARQACPGLDVQEHDLARMHLQPVTAPVLQRKEALCDARRWDDPLLRPAYAFARADAVLITRTMLRAGEEVFLDDTTLEQVVRALGMPVIPVNRSGDALVDALTEFSEG